MLANRTMGGGLPAPSFWLELADAGAGAVNTTPSLANGSPTATFTRATTAWTKLASGLWASVATGIARSCYLGQDTTVGAYGGYLAEGAATQLVTPTASIRDMTDASWVKVTMTTAKTSTGIDGVGSSCTRVTASGANGTILQTLVAAATTRTYSCFIKRITGTGEIDISEDGSTWTNITSQINSTTFTRVSITVSQLNAAFGLRIVTSGDAIDVDFNQFESGGFATSPLDTAGAVRNADILTYASAGNVANATGTMYCEAAAFNTGGGCLIQADDGSTSNRVFLGYNGAGSTANQTLVDATVSQVSQNTANTLAGNTIGKFACTWATNNFNLVLNGSTVVPDTSGSTPSGAFSTISIGQRQAGTLPLYGMTKNCRVWLPALASSQIVSVTQ